MTSTIYESPGKDILLKKLQLNEKQSKLVEESIPRLTILRTFMHMAEVKQR